MRQAAAGAALAALLLAPAAATADPRTLVRAYPGFVAGIEGNDLVMASGARFAISDGIEGKSPAELIARPDIGDIFAYPYPRGGRFAAPGQDQDPGRVRHGGFLAAVYGDCRKPGFGKDIVAVPWLPNHGGGSIRVTRINGVAEKLAAVSRDFEALPAAVLAPLLKDLKPSAGGYVCRPIAGTDILSGHGYGIAVDIATARTDYWYWADPSGRNVRYRNRIPAAIAEVFERHGFISGAKWYHYDTMHFEYRPEFFVD